jgi:hypothetical protein
MGARFRLKANYSISGFGPQAQVVLTAMKHYGLIVADNGSNWFFQGTMDAGWDSGPYPAMIAQLKTVPASAFEAVDESGIMLDSNSAQAFAGGRAPVHQSTPPPPSGRTGASPGPPAAAGSRRPLFISPLIFLRG